MTTHRISGLPESITKDLKLKGFKIHELSETINHYVSPGRRDFYKVGLVTGNMTVYYGDRIIKINDTVLFFVNPNVPHSVVRSSKKTTGIACLFTEAFITGRERTEILKNSPLYKIDGTPVIPLNKEQAAFMAGIFQKMLSVHNGDYDYKNELLKSCIELILHEALRIQPAQNVLQYKNGTTRIANLFMDLLERQFPIDSTAEPLKLRTAQDFAGSLAVHVNYLNRAVKEVTGKPTSVHIADRIAAEAKALLLYTDWSVADVAYGLGFEYPTYFNNYFKRITGTTPNSLRKEKI
ncbi:MAG TPA: helix-turn-helix transcriptional regulator [Bacteroidia bacterium]|nr:helix-turn-helix transcriptional regulator [Bacteroidia bacterium]